MLNKIMAFYNNLRYLLKGKYLWVALAMSVFFLLLMIGFLSSENKEVFLQTQKEVISLVDNIHSHYKVRPDYWGLNTQSSIKNKLIPDNLLRDDKIIGSIGKEFVIGQDIEGNMVMPGTRQFMISIPNISKSTCLGLLTIPVTQEQNLSLTAISITSENTTAEFTWSGDLALPISESTAKQYCKNHNIISWHFE